MLLLCWADLRSWFQEYLNEECLHGCSATAHFPLMHPFGVVVLHPDVHLIQRPIHFSPERNLVKLIQDKFIKLFANSVYL